MKDFCLFACSNQFQLPEKGLEFVGMIQNLCRNLGIGLTHFDYALDQDENGGGLSNEGSFDPDGTDRLKRALAEQPVFELALWSDYDKHPYYDLQSELIGTGRFGGYNYVVVQFPMLHVGNLPPPALFSFVSSLVSALNRIGQLDYALATTMDPALPGSFFRGIFTSNLSDDEALDLATWKLKLNERKIKLRGLYWGNLLGPGHLAQLIDKQAFLSSLETLVGSHRLTTINGETLFFMLPSPDLTSDPVAASVEALLRENDLLMQPDDQAREMMNRSLTRLYAKRE
jgi:hypothetical protein